MSPARTGQGWCPGPWFLEPLGPSPAARPMLFPLGYVTPSPAGDAPHPTQGCSGAPMGWPQSNDSLGESLAPMAALGGLFPTTRPPQ